MSRRHEDLRVYELADALAIDVYRATGDFPADERFELRSQLRRAAVSVPANIVEGCSRRGHREYVHFLEMALGSASETRYLLSLSRRLGFLPEDRGGALERRAQYVVRSLQSLLNALSVRTARV